MEIIYKSESYILQGAIFEVYREMGTGFLENVYQECLENEFKIESIPFKAKVELELFYKGNALKQRYIPDFICYNKIIVEIKALSILTGEHKAQVINY